MGKLYLILLLSLLVIIFLNICQYWKNLFQKYDVSYWESQFTQSQLVIGDKAPYFFSDSELYAIVGYKYLHGDIPTNLHPEVPPLGKILIGSSIFLFNNPTIIVLIFAFFVLILAYITGRLLKLPKSWAILGLNILALDRQFWDLATTSMLDMFLLVFLLVTFISFYQGIKNPKWFWVSSLFLGFVAATKLYFTSIVAAAILILAVLTTGSFTIFRHYLTSGIFFLAGFLLPYISSFLSGLDFIDFLRFQRWLTSWWAGNSKVPFWGILSMIFFGEWHTWWGRREIIPVPNWNIFWPFTAVLTLFSVPFFIKRKNILLLVIEYWVIGYLIFLSITSPFPRYLLLLFPFWVLLALKSIYETYMGIRHFIRRS